MDVDVPQPPLPSLPTPPATPEYTGGEAVPDAPDLDDDVMDSDGEDLEDCAVPSREYIAEEMQQLGDEDGEVENEQTTSINRLVPKPVRCHSDATCL